jgi:perosamine synthetase
MSTAVNMNVPIARTSLTEAEVQSVLGPLRSGWLVQGPKVREFEEKWSAFTGAKHSIAVTSCTTALHLSLAALGLKAGDEVIVPAFTWIATANVVEHLGAKVVFCDIDLNTFNIDVEQLKQKVTPQNQGHHSGTSLRIGRGHEPHQPTGQATWTVGGRRRRLRLW